MGTWATVEPEWIEMVQLIMQNWMTSWTCWRERKDDVVRGSHMHHQHRNTRCTRSWTSGLSLGASKRYHSTGVSSGQHLSQAMDPSTNQARRGRINRSSGWTGRSAWAIGSTGYYGITSEDIRSGRRTIKGTSPGWNATRPDGLTFTASWRMSTCTTEQPKRTLAQMATRHHPP